MEQNYLNYENDLNSKIDDFFSLYNKFMNKNEEENIENIEEYLLIQKKIDPIIFDIEEIFQILIDNLKKNNKNSIKIKDLERKRKKFEEMKNKYKNKYNEIINNLILENNNNENNIKKNNKNTNNKNNKNTNKNNNNNNKNTNKNSSNVKILNDFEIIDNYEGNSNNNNNNNNINNNNKNNEINFNFDEKNMSEQEMNEILNGAMKVQLYFEEYQNSDEYHQKKNEELKQISKLMLQIKELMCTMNQQLYEDDEKLQSIEDCIDESIETVKKGNKELKKAAKDTVETRKIKYIATLGTTLCLLGTFWPGIGNVIGGTLGYFIGKGIAKYEKHKINKIEKKYAKEK
jgi:hypothetical protein